MRRFIRDVKRYLIANWFWIILGLLLTKKAVEVAYQERGCMAIGGEYLVLPVILMTVSLARTAIWTVLELLAEREETIEIRTQRNRRRVQKQRCATYRRRG